jgi:hypothetical protein
MHWLPLGARHVGADRPPTSRKALTRRQLLVRGALATAGLAIAGAALRFASILGEPPRARLRVFSAREAGILEAVLLTFFPGAEGMPPADTDSIIPKLDAFLAQNDDDARLLFKTILHVIEDQCLALRFTRFTKCAPEVRAEEIRAWEVTPIYLKRTAFMSMKVLAATFYVEQPDARAAMGYYLGCQPSHLAPAGSGGAGA